MDPLALGVLIGTLVLLGGIGTTIYWGVQAGKRVRPTWGSGQRKALLRWYGFKDWALPSSPEQKEAFLQKFLEEIKPGMALETLTRDALNKWFTLEKKEPLSSRQSLELWRREAGAQDGAVEQEFRARIQKCLTGFQKPK